ncbi:NAD(P)H-hydrate dehydratase [Candidatus Woesearchaeota archaeon]|nr:NAD(P)H-hydrate dehydratase [Candidatus Woesearchaeota archaeon]
MRYITKRDTKIPIPKKTSHKGENGRVLVVGGSADYAGAVALAGLSALRSGADSVTIAAPSKVAWAINSLSPDLMTSKLDGDSIDIRHLKAIIELSKKADVVLIGNGIGMRSGTQKLVRQAVRRIDLPMVIDADAIKALSIRAIKNSVITPHKTELDFLLNNSGIDKTQLKSCIGDNVVLLKGNVDRIITKNKILYNKTGNPGMTVSGTGDVLAGICAGFIAQGLTPLNSAINAAYFTGLAGDLLKKKKQGYCYIASDVAYEITRVLK